MSVPKATTPPFWSPQCPSRSLTALFSSAHALGVGGVEEGGNGGAQGWAVFAFYPGYRGARWKLVRVSAAAATARRSAPPSNPAARWTLVVLEGRNSRCAEGQCGCNLGVPKVPRSRDPETPTPRPLPKDAFGTPEKFEWPVRVCA